MHLFVQTQGQGKMGMDKSRRRFCWMRKLRSTTRASEEIADSAGMTYHTAKGNGRMAAATAGVAMWFARNDFLRLLMYVVNESHWRSHSHGADQASKLDRTPAPTAAGEHADDQAKNLSLINMRTIV